MSLFQSKVFWVCAVVCIGIAGLFGFNAYKSRTLQDPVVIYKTTQPDPAVKSTETGKEVLEATHPSERLVKTVASLQTQDAEMPSGDGDAPLSVREEIDELTDAEPQPTDPNNDAVEPENNLDLDPDDIAAELNKEFMKVMDRYPLLSMSEAEIMQLVQTREGLRVVQEQAREVHAEMLEISHKYIAKLTDEQKHEAKEETRRILSDHLTHEQIEAYISQFAW